MTDSTFRHRGEPSPVPPLDPKERPEFTDIIKPWCCDRCGSVYHDATGAMLDALRQGKPLVCAQAFAPEQSPSQFYRCEGTLHPLRWP